LSIVLSLLLFYAGCRKEAPYSTWTVDGRAFQCNNVEKYDGNPKGGTPGPGLACRVDGSGFEMELRDGFVTSGTVPLIYDDNYYDGYTGINFYVDTSYYILAPHTTSQLTATSRGRGLASHHLPPTWFHYYYDPTDSVLITGTFNEPE
jgi:hypothetical protein